MGPIMFGLGGGGLGDDDGKDDEAVEREARRGGTFSTMPLSPNLGRGTAAAAASEKDLW